MTKHIVAVLGAPDAEMSAIEALLAGAGIPAVYAAVGGKRCHGGNAYKADGVSGDISPSTAEVWRIECDFHSVAPWPADAKVVVIDHHWPGDPGYGKPPAYFMAASSLGQVIYRLGDRGLLPNEWQEGQREEFPAGACLVYMRHVVERPFDGRGLPVHSDVLDVPCAQYVLPPDGVVYTAAADHCLESAYRGKCPGVDPDRLMEFRARQRSEFRRKSCAVCGGSGLIPNGSSGCAQCGVLDRPDCHNSNMDECPHCGYEAVLADIESARRRLLSAPTCPRHPHGYPIPWVAKCDVRRRTYAACQGGEHDPHGVIVFSGNPVDYLGGLGAFDEWDTHPSRWWEIDGRDAVPSDFLRDLRGESIPELPEAACREGIPYLASVVEPTGRRKVTLGAAPPDLVRRFMAGELVPGLTDYYGDPERGFAGGYEK